jgi:hypothetical protein
MGQGQGQGDTGTGYVFGEARTLRQRQRVVKWVYELDRLPTAQEVQQEVDSLMGRQTRGRLDGFSEDLYYRLGLGG